MRSMNDRKEHIDHCDNKTKTKNKNKQHPNQGTVAKKYGAKTWHAEDKQTKPTYLSPKNYEFRLGQNMHDIITSYM